MKLLPIPKKRNFYMPDGTSSCCKAHARVDGKNDFGGPIHKCSCCGSELHYIGRHPKEANVFTDLTGMFVNDNKYGKRLRQATYKSKYFVGKYGNVVRIETVESYTYNWATGRLYHVQITKPKTRIVRDITYKATPYAIDKKFLKKAIQLRAIYLFPKFDLIRDLEQTFCTDNIFNMVDSMYSRNMHSRNAEKKLTRILYCMAYPKFSWIRCPLMDAPSPQFRKALKTAKKKKDLYSAFFHNNVGKSTIAFLEDESNEETMANSWYGFWWAVRFTSMFVNKDKLWDLINSGWMINLTDNNDYSDMFFDSILKKPIVKGFAEDYGIQRLLNHIAEAATNSRHGGDAKYLLRDSINMWKSIKDNLPEWTLPRMNSLRETHDALSRDSSKLSVENIGIEYNEKEMDLNDSFGNVEFRLPVDVHTIIDYGDIMGICVGGAGYTNGAVQKKMIILFGMINDEPALCMQIQNGRLIQAKLKHNNLAKSDNFISQAIISLCEDNDIDCSGCHDIYDIDYRRNNQLNILPDGDVQQNNFIEEELF